MQVVIDIPKQMYELLQGEEYIDWLDAEHILNAVANGKPLQTDHLIEKIAELDFDFGDYYDHTEEIREKVIETIKKYGGK